MHTYSGWPLPDRLELLVRRRSWAGSRGPLSTAIWEAIDRLKAAAPKGQLGLDREPALDALTSAPTDLSPRAD
jgi:hypothetical protein